jgi:hypothetical protein
LSDFGFSEEEINKKWDTRACYKFVGGEKHAMARVEEFILKTNGVSHYAKVLSDLISNQNTGQEYSSYFSPWL